MNFDNKYGLYEEAKASLKKFWGESGNSEKLSIKFEPAYVAGNEETILAAGGARNHYNRRGQSIVTGGILQLYRDFPIQTHSQETKKKKINAVGADDQTLT